MALSRKERFSREAVGWEPSVGERVVLNPKRSGHAQGTYLWGASSIGLSFKRCGMVRVHLRDDEVENRPFVWQDLRPTDMRRWRHYK